MADVLHSILSKTDAYHTVCCGRFKKRFLKNGVVCCDECPINSSGIVYQIFRYTYQLAIKYKDVKRFLPHGTDLVSYVSNGDRLSLLQPSQRMIGDHTCLACSNLVKYDNQYCSVSCVYDDLLITHEASDERCVTHRERSRKQESPCPSPSF